MCHDCLAGVWLGWHLSCRFVSLCSLCVVASEEAIHIHQCHNTKCNSAFFFLLPYQVTTWNTCIYDYESTHHATASIVIISKKWDYTLRDIPITWGTTFRAQQDLTILHRSCLFIVIELHKHIANHCRWIIPLSFYRGHHQVNSTDQYANITLSAELYPSNLLRLCVAMFGFMMDLFEWL